MINLLLLSAGTNANYQIAKTIKTHFSDSVRLIGADINPQYLIASGIYLDSFYQVPATKETSYYSTILDICFQEKIDYLLPSFDADQLLFFPENEDLIKLGVKSLGTPQESLKYYKNKSEMNAFLKEHHFPIPTLYSSCECQEDVLYMVKPVNGVGSIGAGLKSGKEIKGLSNPDSFVIQERLFEPEVTVECFSFNGQFSCVCRERLATKAGVCTKARLFNDSTLATIAKHFSEVLQTPHIFNLQFMHDKNGEYRITDVNLRTAGGMGLSYAAGWDEISALVQIMLQHPVEKVFATLPHIPETYVIRANEDIVTRKERSVVAFDWDGTLLDSRKRHEVVMNAVLKSFGIDLDVSNLVEFKRSGKNNVAYLISKGIPEEKAQQIQSEWIKHIEDPEYLTQDVLYPEALDMLEKYSKNSDLILVTARNNAKGLQNQIDQFNLRKYFKEVFVVPTGLETPDKKSEILKKQRVSLMIGDTRSDALAASKAGTEFKFHENGFHTKEIIGE